MSVSRRPPRRRNRRHPAASRRHPPRSTGRHPERRPERPPRHPDSDPIPVTGTWTLTSDGGQKATTAVRGPALALSEQQLAAKGTCARPTSRPNPPPP